MEDWLVRTELLLGKTKLEFLKKCTVAIFGIGGVGSYAAEALVRCGIGNIVLIDKDTVTASNINRQLIADTTVVGKPKVEIAKKRYLNINPNLKVIAYQEFYEDSSTHLLSANYNYILDCIDTISSKISLIQKAKELHIPIISSMGTGNKLNPFLFEITDISKTSVCPLAKIIRKELSKKEVKNVKVLYSKESPIIKDSKIIPSISFVPSCAGLMLASEVIKDLLS